jgi:ribosomal protein S18 acetylase RimI-like enzyme
MKDVTPPGVFVVRPARPGDLPEAARLAAELVRLHHRFDPLRFMCIEPIEKGYERFMATQIDREDVVILVAVTEAAGAPVVIGYLIASLEERDWSDLRDACGKIHDVYVAASARGCGVATRLVVDALARLAALGAPRVVLMTAWQNEDARKLFDTLGFRPTMIEMTRESTLPAPAQA